VEYNHSSQNKHRFIYGNKGDEVLQMNLKDRLLEKDITEMTDTEVQDLRENYSTETLLVAILEQLQRIRRGINQ